MNEELNKTKEVMKMFEYKVRCRHKLGWKEIKLYADTDIEEFFNRNSIDYVRNMTDTVEHRQLKEIERLNNIINELERWLKEDLKNNYRDAGYRHNLIIEVLDKLKELKDSD